MWNLSDIERVPNNGLTVFSCFHCGGGSTMGYKLAGFNVLGGVEIDPKMMAIYKQNHKPKLSYLMGVKEFNKIPDSEIPKDLFDLDILDGSPPCSSFSMSGSREKMWGKSKKFREGQSEQILDDLFFDFIETAKKLRPKVVIAENVKGLLMGAARGYVKEILTKLDVLGYKTQIFLLNASSMGVPQKRERVFFISNRVDKKIQLSFNESRISLKTAFENCKNSPSKPISGATLTLWNRCKPGKSFSSVHDKGHRWNWSREDFNSPCRTLTAAGSRMILHPLEPRTFSDLEKCRIQTFPDDYDFMDQDAGYVCGMSVPPIMIKKIAEQVYLQILK